MIATQRYNKRSLVGSQQLLYKYFRVHHLIGQKAECAVTRSGVGTILMSYEPAH